VIVTPRTIHQMTTARRLCEIAHLTSLAVWLGSLVMTGVAAAVVFPTLRGLDPTLPAYAAYQGEHWRLAAGHVASRLFLACDLIQFGAVLAAAFTFALSVLAFGLPSRRVTTALRGALLVALTALLAYQFIILAPEMNASLRRYWEQARAGDTAAAERFRIAFEADHPLATRLLIADAALVLALLVTGLWAQSRDHPRAGPTLEEPLLAGGPR
jgi:hypothetical protein